MVISTTTTPDSTNEEGNASSKPTGVVLSQALASHYTQHEVKGVEQFVASAAGTTATDLAGARFIRLNPRFDSEETLRLLKDELLDMVDPTAVTWLNRCESSEASSSSARNGNNNLQYYSIPASFALAQSQCYQSGRIYGMDVSSGAAIAALLFSSDENDGKQHHSPIKVLDLCCSPGLKLCTIVDILEQQRRRVRQSSITQDGSRGPTRRSEMNLVVGIDVSSNRMNLCKSVIQKYLIDSETSGRKQQQERSTSGTNDRAEEMGTLVQLFCTDGTSFGAANLSTSLSLMSLHGNDLVFDSLCAMEEEEQFEKGDGNAKKRKRMNKSARSRERRRLRNVVHAHDINGRNGGREAAPAPDLIVEQFDRVLVDAECSTDGAIRHLQHKVKKGALTTTSTGAADGSGSRTVLIENDTLTERDQLTKLVNLQRQLILSGFRLLKEDGIMVYSTCSLSREQNEDVVSWLLEKERQAFVIPVTFPEVSMPSQQSMVKEGFLSGTVRFQPYVGECNSMTYGGGFFVAKLEKRRQHSETHS